MLNYEEGGERSLLEGDPESESYLQEVVGAPPTVGRRNLNTESMFEFGSRAGFWRVHRIFTAHGLPLTVYAVGRALEQNPAAARAMVDAGWEVASHGWRWPSRLSLVTIAALSFGSLRSLRTDSDTTAWKVRGSIRCLVDAAHLDPGQAHIGTHAKPVDMVEPGLQRVAGGRGPAGIRHRVAEESCRHQQDDRSGQHIGDTAATHVPGLRRPGSRLRSRRWRGHAGLPGSRGRGAVAGRRAGGVRQVRLFPWLPLSLHQRLVGGVVQPGMPLRRNPGRLGRAGIGHPAPHAVARTRPPLHEIGVAERIGADAPALEPGEQPGAEVHAARYTKLRELGPPGGSSTGFCGRWRNGRKMRFPSRGSAHSMAA